MTGDSRIQDEFRRLSDELDRLDDLTGKERTQRLLALSDEILGLCQTGGARAQPDDED